MNATACAGKLTLELLEQVLESLMVPMIVLAEDDELVYVNGAGEAWLFESGVIANEDAQGARRLAREALPRDALRSELWVGEGLGLLAHRPASAVQKDPVSGLPNATVAFTTLSKSLVAARRLGNHLCVTHLATDMSRRVGITRGRSDSARFEQALGERVRSLARRGEYPCSLGAGNYCILSMNCEQVEDAFSHAARWVEGLSRPLAIEGRDVVCNVAAGIAIAPQHGDEAGELLDRAGFAAHLAGLTGRNAIQPFSETLAAAMAADMELESELAQGIERGELSLVYQPKVYANGKSVALTGAEALVRWSHPQLGTISPARFIPIAERAGLMPRLGQWILDRVCAQVASWRQAGLYPVPVAVNVSGQQLAQAHFRLQVEQCLGRHRLSSADISLEITESALLQDVDESIRLLESLRAMGLQIAIDDFGTGYSSLGYLRRFPANLLKIDRSFVDGIEDDFQAAGIFQAIVGMAETLNLELIVEGVESEAQHRALVNLGCVRFQGYLFGRPERPEVFAERWLQAGTLVSAGAPMTQAVVAPR